MGIMIAGSVQAPSGVTRDGASVPFKLRSIHKC